MFLAPFTHRTWTIRGVSCVIGAVLAASSSAWRKAKSAIRVVAAICAATFLCSNCRPTILIEHAQELAAQLGMIGGGGHLLRPLSRRLRRPLRVFARRSGSGNRRMTSKKLPRSGEMSTVRRCKPIALPGDGALCSRCAGRRSRSSADALPVLANWCSSRSSSTSSAAQRRTIDFSASLAAASPPMSER